MSRHRFFQTFSALGTVATIMVQDSAFEQQKQLQNSMLMLQVQMCGCPCLICACDIGFNWKCFLICAEERLKGICIGVNFCSSVAKTWRYLFEINLN
jgi:hypothetical protein